MVGQVQTKKKALEAAESLLGYPDTKVKTIAQAVADYLKGLPAGIDEYVQAITPQGSAMARVELQISAFLAAGTFYEFRRPVRVIISRDNGYFLAWSNRFLVHGTGDSADQALRDYMEEWRRHYEFLLKEAERLVPPLQKELAGIQRLLLRQRDAA